MRNEKNSSICMIPVSTTRSRDFSSGKLCTLDLTYIPVFLMMFHWMEIELLMALGGIFLPVIAYQRWYWPVCVCVCMMSHCRFTCWWAASAARQLLSAWLHLREKHQTLNTVCPRLTDSLWPARQNNLNGTTTRPAKLYLFLFFFFFVANKWIQRSFCTDTTAVLSTLQTLVATI